MSKEDLRSPSNNCSPKGRKSYNDNVNMLQNKKLNKKISDKRYDEKSENYVSQNESRNPDHLEDSSDNETDESDIDETEVPVIDKSSNICKTPEEPKRTYKEKKAADNNVRTPSHTVVPKGTPIREPAINNEVYTQANSLCQVLPIFFAVLLCGLAYFSSYINYDNTNISDITYMKRTYPSQPNETWDNIVAVIDDIRRPSAIHPAVFLFLYDTKNNGIDKLVHDLAKYASEKLETNQDFIEMQEREFLSEEAISDYGFLIDKYASEISEKKVMVVKDLQNIPGQVAQAFHTFCDEISPLAESVVYIFTLKVNSLDGKEETIAEYHLKESWKDLDEDKLMPLVTRVTGSVFKAL